MYDLLGSQNVSRGNTGARSADVQRLGELNELSTGRISSPNKDRYLQANSGAAPRGGDFQALLFLEDIQLHVVGL